jgi:hypothetical protein
MEVITNLIAQKFSVFNVDKDSKLPVKRDGNGMSSWQKLSAAVLQKHHNMNSLLWGMRMGLHENNRYIMSLDFDCCGEKHKQTGERMGCDYTKQKLAEYISIVDKEDGWYYSSTVGNENVLVDYTNTPEIIRLMEDGGSKWTINSMEVLLGSGHQQVIPPAATVCKINGKVMQPRTFKNDKIFYELTEESPIYPFILQLYTDYKKFKAQPLPTKKVIVKKEMNKKETEAFENALKSAGVVDKWVQLLYNVIGNEIVDGKFQINGQKWFQVAGILKTNGYHKDIFMDWTKKAEKNKKKLQEASDTWEAINSNKNMALQGLKKIARWVDEDGYKAWVRQYDEFMPLKILTNGENEIAKYIAEQLQSDLIFCNNNWFMFDERTKLWRIVANPHAIVISHIQHKIDESREVTYALKQQHSNDEEKKKEFDDNVKEYNKHYKEVGKGAVSSQIVKLLQQYLFDADFDQKLDTIPYKIAFTNGILDLKTLIFKEGLDAGDYLTKTIKYDYQRSSDKDRAKVRHELLKICNMNEEHLEYYLSFIGYSLTGDASRVQEFWAFRGQKACNGKSVIFEALTEIMSNYVVKLEGDIFEKNYGSRHKEFATWKGIRIGWVNELSKKKTDAEVIKNLADGTSVRYKVNYGTMAMMIVTLKLMFISNNTLNMDVDAAIKRRLNVVQLDSEFLKGRTVDDYENKLFIMDDTFGDLLKTTYKFALLDLLFEYSKKFVDDGYKLKPIPIEWKNETDEVVADNNETVDFIEDRFEFVTGYKTSKMDVDFILRYGKIDVKEFKDTLKCMRKTVTYKGDEYLNGSKKKGCWTGLKVKEEEPPKPADVDVGGEEE